MTTHSWAGEKKTLNINVVGKKKCAMMIRAFESADPLRAVERVSVFLLYANGIPHVGIVA